MFRDEPTLDCEGKSAEKIPYVTEEHFVKCIKDSFGNAVGRVTNVGSSCYDKISLFDKDSEEYKELDYRIKCIQYYQQECIDSAKNGVPPKPIPSYWNNSRSEMIKIHEEDEGVLLETKKFYNRVLVDKKPYYFRYIYDDTNSAYNTFMKKVNDKCISLFRKDYDELLSQDTFTEDEALFVKLNERKNPISNNPCIVNKIAHIVEDSFDMNFGNTKTPTFDYSVYQDKYETRVASKNIQEQIVSLIKEFNQIKSDKKKNDICLINKDTIADETILSNSLIIDKLKEVISNSQVLLNTLLLLAYKKNIVGKWLVWETCGDTMLENLLNNNNRLICYPSRDDNGDLEYCGHKFSMINKYIKGDTIECIY